MEKDQTMVVVAVVVAGTITFCCLATLCFLWWSEGLPTWGL